MSDNVLKYQCPRCTGPMHFDIEKQLLVCDYCESEYPESYFLQEEADKERTDETSSDEKKDDSQVDWKLEGYLDNSEVLEEQRGFVCTSCGAEVVSDGNTVSTECMYCGNPIVFTDKVEGMVKPDLVIPFQVDKEKAQKTLKAFYNKKILLPKAFKDENRIRKIAGMYVPFWLFSGTGEGRISGTATKVSTYTQGEYEVTKTKYYNVSREGNMGFEKIPVDASRKMEDNYMDGLEPFHYDDLKPFSTTYMAGFFADKFDVSVKECATRAKRRVVNSTESALKNTISGYSNVTINNNYVSLSDEDVKYALLPVWMLNTKFEDKMYHFAINGQTGKVSGDLPIDKKKQKCLFWGITGVSYVVLALLSFVIFLS